VQNIESGSKEVYEGTDIINRALSSLEAISTEALQTAKKVQEIATSTQGQVKAAENVTKLTAEVASVAEETAASAEQVSAATEEQTASMQEVTNAAQELAKIAEKSQGLIARFKTDHSEEQAVPAAPVEEPKPTQENKPFRLKTPFSKKEESKKEEQKPLLGQIKAITGGSHEEAVN
jgi:methyl-accepting chemotaxis protein